MNVILTLSKIKLEHGQHTNNYNNLERFIILKGLPY